MFLVNAFTYVDDRLQDVVDVFTRQLAHAKDADCGYLVIDMRVSFMSNKKAKERTPPLDLNYCPVAFRRSSLQGVRQSLSLIE